MTKGQGAKVGHGDHWLAALEQGDPRLREVLEVPLDVGPDAALHRRPLTEAVDLVQVTTQRRLVTAYPEPRATALHDLRPRELALWETGAEGWLVAEHEGAGALTLFLTDLVENAAKYQKAKRALHLEVGALAYEIHRASPGASRLLPASRMDARFLPDDYWFQGDVLGVTPAGAGEVLDIAFQNGLHVPVATRAPTGLATGARAEGLLWLTARWPSA